MKYQVPSGMVFVQVFDEGEEFSLWKVRNGAEIDLSLGPVLKVSTVVGYRWLRNQYSNTRAGDRVQDEVERMLPEWLLELE